MLYVMVLNDGETYTDLKGCRIVAVTDEQVERANQGDIDLDIIVEALASGPDAIQSLSENGEPVDPARVGHVVTTF